MSRENYLYTFQILNERKGEICLVDELSESQLKHRDYVNNHLAKAVVEANCGWSALKYICIKYPNSNYVYPYMVLYVGNKPERWIPVDGNSDGCNLQVIGENLW